MTKNDAQILIVGAGPVGLSASLLLADQGISSIVVERHETTATHPKASYFNTRTMEILQQIGVANDVYAQGAMPGGAAFYTNLKGYRLGNVVDDEFIHEYSTRVLGSTATPGCISSQIVLEGIFRHHAEQNPLIDLRFSHRCGDVRQNEIAIEADVTDIATDQVDTIRAHYLVACDGARSSIRDQLGRKLIGPDKFGHMINVYIEADLNSLVDEKNQALYWISNPESSGVFIGLGGDWQKWCYNFNYDPNAGERFEDFTEEKCRARICKALGTDELTIDILSIGPWEMCSQVIDQFKDGRIFFAGDAAHLTLPTGGFGFNTGMQESHNLAWKLAAVLNGQAGEALLDSYHVERRPIAVFNVEASDRNAKKIATTGAVFGGQSAEVSHIEEDSDEGARQRAAISNAIHRQRNHFFFLGQEVGFGYWDSPIVTQDGSRHYGEEHGIDNTIVDYVPNARPGARAPHITVLTRAADATPQSIHDHLHGHFTWLVRGNGDQTKSAMEAIRNAAPQALLSVGSETEDVDLVDVEDHFASHYGLEPGGAVLVRPDGHVAWRSVQAPSKADLERALKTTLSLN